MYLQTSEVHHSPSQRPLTVWWKRFLNVVCACKQKRPEPVRIFITPIGFWGLGFAGNSGMFAHTINPRQGSVPKDQSIGQPVAECLCVHFATLEKRVLGRINKAPASSATRKNQSPSYSNPWPLLILLADRLFYQYTIDPYCNCKFLFNRSADLLQSLPVFSVLLFLFVQVVFIYIFEFFSVLSFSGAFKPT
jgi:hypothetical protein